MSKESLIQWCDSTINPTTGCDGCELWNAKHKYCYAGTLHEGRMATSLPLLYAKDFTEVRMVPGRMAGAAAWSDLSGTDRPDKPWLDGMPRIIFVSDMSDALSEAVTFEFLKREIIDNVTSAKGRRHIWMWLTKQSRRLVHFFFWLRQRGIDWPENLWIGVSVTSQPTVKRVSDLQQIGDDSTVRFVSAEPLKEYVNLGDLDGIKLVITGGASEQKDEEVWEFDIAWAYSILSQCRVHGVAAFVKQLGAHVIDNNATSATHFEESQCWPDGTKTDYHRVLLKDSHGGDWKEWPQDLRVRDFPQLQPLTKE